MMKIFANHLRVMIRRHTTRIEPLSIAKLIKQLKRHQSLQPLFNAFAFTLKSKVRKTSFGYAKVEIKFLADRTWSVTSDCR